MNKSIKMLVTTGLLSFGLLGIANAADKITIKFSHVVAENTPKGKMAKRFKEILEERAGDKVEVQIYPNSQLFGDNKVLEAMLLGDVQIAAPTLSKFSRYTKKLQVYDLPFLFSNMEAVERFQKGEHGQKLLTSMERKGIIGLGYLHNGLKQMSAYTPIKVPKDAVGKKFRIMSSDVLQEQFDALGAIPLKKPFSEVFTLLQTRAIDGAENPWSNIYSKKFHEVQPYITETNHGLVDYMVVTSKSFLNSLTPELQSLVKHAMSDAIAYGNQVACEKSVSDRQAIIDSGHSKLIQLTDSERKKWVSAMKPVWNTFESDIGKELINAAVSSNKSSSSSQGCAINSAAKDI